MLATLTRLPADFFGAIQLPALRVLGIRNQRKLLPRRQCHFVVLNAKGFPPRYMASALKLQLIQLGFVAQPGFAWRLEGDNAHVWYWDEGRVRAEWGEGGWIVQPEPLLRAAPSPGIRLLRCAEGFEAEFVGVDGGFRTRWFAQEPTDAQWAEFCRDAALDAGTCPRPAPAAQPLKGRLAKGWRVHSGLTRTLSFWAWLGGAIVLAYGCVVANLGVQSVRLGQEIAAVQAKAQRLQRADSRLASAQGEIDKLNTTVGALNALRPARTQLSLMQDLAKQGVIGTENGVVLTNWSYQNHRLSMTFYTARAALTGSELVVRIEKLPALHKVQLMTDAQPGFLVIQAALDGAEASPGKGDISRTSPPGF